MQAFARAGHLAASDMLWSASIGFWMPAQQAPGLVVAAPVGPTTKPQPAPRKRNLLGPSLGLVALLALIGGGYWAWRQRWPAAKPPRWQRFRHANHYCSLGQAHARRSRRGLLAGA